MDRGASFGGASGDRRHEPAQRRHALRGVDGTGGRVGLLGERSLGAERDARALLG